MSSRSPQAEAYDRARIRLELNYLRIPKLQRIVARYAQICEENRRNGTVSHTQIRYLNHYQHKLEDTQNKERRLLDRIHEADQKLGQRVMMEYEHLRKRGYPRETADQIARTNNSKYDTGYYRAQARREFERDDDA